ncbi:MAG: exopolysaccharide biosynthesis polyprenyl glycosylphosphotransferase [Bacilli bacterium]
MIKSVFGKTIDFYANGYILLSFVYIIVFVAIVALYGGFKIGSLRLFDILFSIFLSITLTSFLTYFEISLISRKFVSIFGILFIWFIQILIALVITYIEHNIFYILFEPRNALFITDKNDDNFLIRLLKSHNKNVMVISTLSSTEFLLDIPNLKNVECIFLANISFDNRSKITQICYDNNVFLYLVPTFYDVLISCSKDTHFIDTPIFQLNNFGPTQISKIIKRVFDILISIVVLILSVPIFLLVAISIKCEDNGPILYYQNRLTQYGRVFSIIKFRSMKVNSEANGLAVFAEENDPRITKVGKILRKFRIDELPQFYNILIGDMSLVGPRPERPEIAAITEKSLPEFKFRLKVKAGLTGYAQVYGKYNTLLKDKLLLDIMYIEQFSLLSDFKILILTVKTLFTKESTEGVKTK